jgi:alkylhydroperoxidase family enzyme
VWGDDLLMRFGEAALADSAHLSAARLAVVATLGEAAMIDAAAVIGIFNAVVRVADATGIPLEAQKVEMSADLRQALGTDAYRG